MSVTTEVLKRGYWAGRTSLRIAVWVLFIVMITTSAVIFIGSKTNTFRVTSLLTNSMSPDTPAGSASFMVSKPSEQVRVGDVIAITPPDSPGNLPWLHRVVQTWKDEEDRVVVVTKGDANGGVDNFTPVALGPRVWEQKFSVPYMGHLFLNVNNQQTRMLIVGVMLALMLITGLRAIWEPAKKTPAPVYGPFRNETRWEEAL